MISLLRSVIRSVRSEATRVSPIRRLLLGALLVPPFSLVLILVRLRAIFAGPLVVDTTDRFGMHFRCHLPDLIQMYIHLFSIWEPDLTHYIRRTLRRDRVFVDVGANIGYFSLHAAELVGPGGRVIAIDASPPIFDALKQTIALNPAHAQIIEPHNVAVSDERGRLDIYSGPAHNLGLTSTEQHRGMTRTHQVDALPIDDIVADDLWKNIQLIKIDVEGGEDRVLRGLAECLDRLPDDAQILVELSPAWWRDENLTPRDVLEPFIRAGFNVYEIPNSYWPWRYAWPNDVQPPRRLKMIPTQRVSRLDLMLSRRDTAEL